MDLPSNILYELTYQTAKLISKSQKDLQKIKWTNGESNIDMEYSLLACECCKSAWNNIIKKKYEKYNDIEITCKPPDININLYYNNLNNDIILNKKIELKSSKSVKMPGSTINKLDINMPIIYCLRPKK